MRFSIYLSNDIINVLQCFGSIDDVTNKILECGAEGLFDIMDKPTPPPKQDGHQVVIDVIEPTYLELVDAYTVRSSRISLRRLLYWFVENEIYAELGWEEVQKYKSSTTEKAIDMLADIKLQLYRLEKLVYGCDEETEVIRQKLNEIEGKIWDA